MTTSRKQKSAAKTSSKRGKKQTGSKKRIGSKKVRRASSKKVRRASSKKNLLKGGGRGKKGKGKGKGNTPTLNTYKAAVVEANKRDTKKTKDDKENEKYLDQEEE